MSFQPPERKHLGRVHTCLRAAAPARAATSRALWPPGPRGRPGAAWGRRDALQRARPARGRLASDHGVAASSQGSRRGGPRGLSGSLEVAWFPPGVNAGLAVCPSQRPSARPSSEAAEAAGQRGPGRQVPLGHGDCTRAGSAPASSRPAARNSIWVLGKSVYYGFYDY